MADEALVDLALSKGIITEAQLQAARDRQEDLASRGLERSLWLLLQDDGSVDSEVARDLERRTSSDNLDALVVDGYIIQGRIGKGGMGEVFYGVRQDGTESAIKILPTRLAKDQEYLGRFQREVEALSRLKHPFITEFRGRGTTGGRPYLIMELVKGQSLKERLQNRGAITELEARVLLRQMCDALEASWNSAGLVHRDIKPANILLADPDDAELPFVAKLCDFGLAKFQGRSAYTVSISQGGLTHSGVAIGTPHYMSPEQATGDRSVDQRHDIYGLGATIYHALLGKTLYSGGSSAVIMYKQATAALDMAPLSKHGVTPEFTVLIKSMLAKPADKRIAEWALVRKELDRLPPDSDLPQTHKPRAKPIDVAKPPPPMSTNDVGTRPAGRRTAGLLPLVFMSVAVVCVIAGVLLSQLGGNAVVREFEATPETLVAVLGEAREAIADQAGRVSVRLAPGIYPRLEINGSDHGLRLQGSAGAVIENPDLAVVIGEGVRNVELIGLSIRAVDGQALTSYGEQVLLRNCRIGPCRRAIDCATGRLVLEQVQILDAGSGIDVQAGSELAMKNCLLVSEGAALRSVNASIGLSNTRIQLVGPETDAGCRFQGGVVTLRSVHMGGAGSWTSLAFDKVGLAQIQDVFVEGGTTALAVRDSALDTVEGLHVQARDVGLLWRGDWSREWNWSRIRVDAERPFDGLTVEQLGDAMHADGDIFLRLADVPDLPTGK